MSMRGPVCAGIAIIVMLLLAACGHESGSQVADRPSATTGDIVSRGHYLLRAGDCQACHTQTGGEAFAGGRAVPTPFGTIFTPNITPDPQTGLGAWNADDFWRALHEGKSRDGHLLYPAFPFDSYTRVRRADSDAMFAALKDLQPVRQKNREAQLSFPYDQRKLLLAWRALFFDQGVYQDDSDKSAEWNRGAYLVDGLGHCKACHTPRNFLGASKSGRELAGGLIPVQNWYAPDLHNGPGGGLYGWQRKDIIALLKTGRSERGTAYGPMAEVVRESLQYLNDKDIGAIATYLLDQPQAHKPERFKGLSPSTRRAVRLVDRGKDIYQQHCADCHGKDGEGKGLAYPPLAANTSLLGDSVNAVRMVLLGGFQPTTQGNPRPYSMPPFAPGLDDGEVAAVVSYIRQSFGNDADAVSPQTVARYRSTPLR